MNSPTQLRAGEAARQARLEAEAERQRKGKLEEAARQACAAEALAAAVGASTPAESAARAARAAGGGPADVYYDAELQRTFHPSGIKIRDMEDSLKHRPHYAYTVTGMRRLVEPKEGRPQCGVEVVVEGKELALFRVGDAALAFDARCPHAGGQIALGDIEDIGGERCVTCPRHRFNFSCSTGTSVAPKGTFHLGRYPTSLSRDGVVMVGLRAGLGADAFEDEDF